MSVMGVCYASPQKMCAMKIKKEATKEKCMDINFIDDIFLVIYKTVVFYHYGSTVLDTMRVLIYLSSEWVNGCQGYVFLSTGAQTSAIKLTIAGIYMYFG